MATTTGCEKYRRLVVLVAASTDRRLGSNISNFVSFSRYSRTIAKIRYRGNEIYRASGKSLHWKIRARTDNFPSYRNRNLIYPGNVVMAISSLDEIKALCIV